MKTLIFERLNGALVNDKLNNMSNLVNQDETTQMVQLIVKPNKKHKNSGSPKHGWTANVPFPALIKHMKDGSIAAFHCVTGKQEILPFGTFHTPTPLGKKFEYKGHRYVLQDTVNGHPRYTLEK